MKGVGTRSQQFNSAMPSEICTAVIIYYHVYLQQYGKYKVLDVCSIDECTQLFLSVEKAKVEVKSEPKLRQ